MHFGTASAYKDMHEVASGSKYELEDRRPRHWRQDNVRHVIIYTAVKGRALAMLAGRSPV